MTTFTKHFFNSSNEAEVFFNNTKGAYSLSTVSKEYLHLGNWVVCVEVEDDQKVITLPKLTEKLKSDLKAARIQLTSLGYIEQYGIMHSDVKTKYNFGTVFMRFNEANKTSEEFVLNVLTVNELPNH